MEVFVCAFFKASGHSAMHFLKAFKASGFIKVPPPKKGFRKGGVLEEGF
ncbi:hypothetical protein KVL42_00065 [Helicobacter pylori]|nr:hypothetical protein KVL42_00065 [Helicobacter pylori]